MNFAVFLMGENYIVAGQPDLQGFFITVRVEASSEELAAAQAVAAVEADPRLSRVSSVAPTITVKVVHQLPESNLMKGTEYLFFPMRET